MSGARKAKATGRNPDLVEAPRKNEDNLQWLERGLDAGPGGTGVVLVGGTSPAAFRLRVAQAETRHDMQPSFWSHGLLVGDREDAIGDTAVYEVSLEPPGGFGFPPPDNAVQNGRLAAYADPTLYPNIALLWVPVSADEVQRRLADFRMQRPILDLVELALRWLAYVWGVARAANPLFDGQGIPSAVLLEVVMGAAGFDLTPGIESRASTPEAIWQAVNWWHEYHQSSTPLPQSDDSGAGGEQPALRNLAGRYWAPHWLASTPPARKQSGGKAARERR